MQAVNTYEHHENSVRGGDRAERNMLRTVTGEFGNIDRSTWATLSKILIAAPDPQSAPVWPRTIEPRSRRRRRPAETAAVLRIDLADGESMHKIIQRM